MKVIRKMFVLFVTKKIKMGKNMVNFFNKR